MYELFKAKAEVAGAEVHRMPSKQAALDFVINFLGSQNISATPAARAVWADGPFLQGLNAADIQKKVLGLTTAVSRESSAEARIGITDMAWALADTGSLVADQTAAEQRLASTLPEIHVALIPSQNILPGKAAVFSKLSPHTARFIAFITGPSRTADIERVLTIGVHGPKRLIIVFVDGWKGGAA